MKIDEIEIFHLALPLTAPQRTPCGTSDRLETIYVRLQSGDNEGWGEATPGNAPLVHGESAASVFLCLRNWLAPAIAGKSVESGTQLHEYLAPFRGNRFAKAALDTAWWDLHARGLGKPLAELLGGTRQAVDLGVAFDQMDSVDELIEQVGGAFESGFSRVELKLRPGWDVQVLNFVRQEFPVQTIHVDIEGAMRLENMELLYRMDDFSLAMVEQPLPGEDLVGMAMVQEGIRTPVGLDEAIVSPHHAELAIELRSGRFLNMKVGRTGGITPLLEIRDMCRQGEIQCFAGSELQSALGMRFAMAVASLPECTYPADFVATDRHLAEQPVPPLEAVRQGEDHTLQIPLWSEPGVGIVPDRQLLEKFAIDQARFPSP